MSTPSPPAGPWFARTVDLVARDVNVDLNDVAGSDGLLFVRDGVGFAGQAVAARVGVDEAVDFLGGIEHTDERAEAGTGPVAIGALPFQPGAVATLTVPARTVGKASDGRRWLTLVASEPISDGDVDEALAEVGHVDVSVPSAAEYAITPGVAIDHYLAAVAAARDAVRAGELDKAVIARPVMVTSSEPFDVAAILHRLKASFGSSYRFSIDGFIGASPELLVEVDGPTVRSRPLAGTTRTTGDPVVDQRLAAELQASPKNQIEHRAAIEMVRDTLLPYCSYLDWSPEPAIVKVANVQHLGSEAEGHLSQPQPTVIELVRALQPTPAVGGYPRDAAIALIEQHEGFSRGLYGGCVGWVDGSGNGTWAVSLRCAEFSEDRRSARLVAGGGIVAESDPLAELAETQAKLQAMLSALIRP